MHPRVSINTLSSINWPLERDLACLRELGAHHISFPMLKIESDPAAGIAAIRESGLDIGCLAASGSSASLQDDALAVLKPSIDASAKLGGPLCYFTAGKAPPRSTTDEACAALVAALKPVKAYADSVGVLLGIENNSAATRHHGFVHSVRDAVQFAEEADIQVCLELQNCWFERDLARTFRNHIGRIAMVQVSDYMPGEELRLNRRVPGDGEMPVARVIEQLLEAGYAGMFDIEILGPHIEAEGYARAIGRAADWLGETLTRCGA
jgi:sugar phosphate isomerase/epimerase